MSTILSVIIVNYGAADYVRICCESIQEQTLLTRPGDGIEVVVVDNFSSTEEQQRIQAMERTGVKVVLLPDNPGYSTGLVRGLEEASGDKICFLNPDVRFLPGALATLCRFLDQSADVGAVTPRAWLDEERLLIHPPHRLPGLSELLVDLGCRKFRWIARAADRFRTGSMRDCWTASSPKEASMLTGCCLLTSRRILDVVGPPDPIYPLYFEDSDWCRRVRRAKLRLVYHPGAELIHFYSVSANQGLSEAFRKLALSREIYYRRYYGRAGLSLARSLWKRLEGMPRKDDDGVHFDELGELESAPTVDLPLDESGEGLIAMAGTPSFDLSVGGIVRGQTFTLSETTWRHMYPTRYYLRLVNPVNLRVLRAWTFVKPAD